MPIPNRTTQAPFLDFNVLRTSSDRLFLAESFKKEKVVLSVIGLKRSLSTSVVRSLAVEISLPLKGTMLF